MRYRRPEARLRPGWLVVLFAAVLSVSAWLPWLTTSAEGGGRASAIGGAVGSIDAPLALAPWHYVALYDAWKRGDMARAQALQDEVRPFVDLVWMYGAPAHVCKVVLSARLGMDCGRPIPPVNRLNDEEQRDVLRVAEALGVTRTHY